MMLPPSMAVNVPRISSKKLPSSQSKSRRNKSAAAFIVPPALPRKKMQPVDVYFEAKKKELAHRLPILNAEDIKRLRLPFKEYVLDKLHEKNYVDVAHELEIILRKEEVELLASDDPTLVHQLSSNEKLLLYVTQKLQLSSELAKMGKYESAYNVRRALAEEFLKKGDKVWLVKHLYKTCVDLVHHVKQSEIREKLESETKCVLGYLELDNADRSDAALRNSMVFLEQARELSRGQCWKFVSKVVVLKIKRPICVYGLRQDFEVIHSNVMTIYDMASLLLYETLTIKASSLIFDTSPSNSELDTAYDNANRALTLAEEAGNSTAINSSFMVLGALHLQRGDLSVALDFFVKLQKHAEAQQDYESSAVAFNMIGCTYMGLKDSVNALENFVRQKEIGDDCDISDLKIDALQNIGFLLMEEGQLMEAEECLSLVVDGLKKVDTCLLMDPERTLNNAWIIYGISAGINGWGRMAGHCRRMQHEDLTIVSKWKGYRRTMDRVDKPLFEIQHVQESFPQYESGKKLLGLSLSQANEFLMANKKFIDGISDDGIPFDAHSSSTVADVMVQNRIMIQVAAAREPRVQFERYDKGQHVLYDSDLRENVTRVGRKYQQGDSMWSLMPINNISSDSDSVIAVAEDESGTLIQKLSKLERDFNSRQGPRRTILLQPLFSNRAKSRKTIAIKSSSESGRKQEGIMSKTNMQGPLAMDRDSLWRMSQKTLYNMNRYSQIEASKPLIDVQIGLPAEPEVVGN